MLFNSLDFAVFLPIVFGLYWLLSKRNISIQNFFLIVVSYVFYGWWDPRFLLLIVLSSSIDFYIGQKLESTLAQKNRKKLLYLSLFANLGTLVFFKYFNFFVDSFTDAFTLFGSKIDPIHLNIILPVGISFYTFQTLSYTIDVYRGNLKATKDPFSFFAFVSFFPQLVAGPIERASNLLPQFYVKRSFNYLSAVDGCRQILWGFFKKIVIADNCSIYVQQIFDNYQDATGSTLLFGAILFSFQIYGDFSGYSDIAIGTSRLFGFNLKRNFAFPYFSRDIAEFWRRWHISLSTWFRDYLYIPLGGSKGNLTSKIRNTFIIFVVSGFWHGANWTFVIWGTLNAIYFLPLLLLKRNRNNINHIADSSFWPSPKQIIQILFTFFITTIAWVFFRADTVEQAVIYITNMANTSLFSLPDIDILKSSYILISLILLFILIEWIGRKNEYAIEKLALGQKRSIRWLFYSLIIFIIGMYGNFEETAFIYFQF